MKSTARMLGLIFTMVILAQLAIDLYIPSLPFMTADLDSSSTGVQQSITAYLLAYSLVQLVVGPLSDTFGRRLFVIGGLVCYLLGAVGSAFSNTLSSLLWMRSINGLGAGTLGVLSLSIMRDTFRRRHLRTVASYLAATFALVPIFAPVVGGYIQATLGWRANFLTIALCGTFGLVAMLFLLPETKLKERRQHFHPAVIASNYWTLLRNRRFVGFVLTAGLINAIYIAYAIASPFLLQGRLGLSAPQFGWSILLVGVSVMSGGYISGRLSRHISLPRLAFSTLTVGHLSGIAFLALGLLGVFTVPAILVPAFVLFLGLGILWPNTSAGAMEQFPQMSGSSAALLCSVAAGTATLVSYVVARLPDQTQVPLGWTELILMTLSLLVLGVLALRTPSAQGAEPPGGERE